MANVPQSAKCDLCHRSFNKAIEVRGSLSIDNGGKIVIVEDLCRQCGNRVLNMIGVSFPKATMIERVTESIHV